MRNLFKDSLLRKEKKVQQPVGYKPMTQDVYSSAMLKPLPRIHAFNCLAAPTDFKLRTFPMKISSTGRYKK